MRLKDKIALVTGATSGIGKAIVELFAHEGAKVAVAGTTIAKAKSVANAIIANGGNAFAVAGDISVKSNVEQMYNGIIDHYGQIDILVNNAGFHDKSMPSHLTDEALWDKVIDIDMKGTYLVTNAALQSMFARQSGVIVNIGSIAGLGAKYGGVAYTSAKHAMIGYTKRLAFDYGKKGIRTNIILPGIIETKFFTENVTKEEETALRDYMQQLPAGRVGYPEDIAKAALFLASSDAEYMHGSSLVIDGGMVLQ